MRRFQTDPVSERTSIFVNAFLAGRRFRVRRRDDTALVHAANILGGWNQRS